MLRLSIFGTFRVVGVSGDEIPVKSRKARALLAYLALPPGKARSREQIMALLWSDRGDQQARSSLRQALSGLRKDLGEKGRSALRTTDESLMLDPAQVDVEPASPGDVLLDGLHLTDPAFEEWLRDERLRHEDIAAPDKTPTELSLPDKPSVAVLPFINMSGDPEQEYFSDGITEDIITEVSRFRELFVTARNSSFTFKDEHVDIKKVGERLGVRFVVKGSVRKAGERVRITAQLIEAATGSHVWAERYDRDLADIFEVQDDVARAIATVVAGRVRSSTVEQLRRRPTENLTAYDLYLRAIAYTEIYSNPDDFEPFLVKAIELDPNFAAVRAALAITQVFRHLLEFNSSCLKVGLDHARVAINLDANDNRCQMAMGLCLYSMGQLDEAKVYLDRSIALNANDAWGHGASGFCLMYLGQLDEALTAIDMALRLDPFGNEWFWDGRGMILMIAHRFEEAVEAFQHMSQPASWSIAYEAICFAELGRMDEARANIAKFQQIAASRTARDVAYDEPFRDGKLNDWIYARLVELGLPSG